MAMQIADLDQCFIIDEDPGSALQTAMGQISTAIGSGDAKGRALGLIKAGAALALMGKFDDAVGQVQEAQGLCGELKFEEGLASAFNAMAMVYLKQGFFDEAIDAAKDSLKGFKKAGFKKGEGMAMLTLSKVYCEQGDGAAAVKSVKEALSIFAAMGDSAAVAAVYLTTCSEAYLGKGDTYRAAKNVGKAIPLYEGMGAKGKVAACYAAMAKIELAGKDYAKVSDYVAKAVAASAEAGDPAAGGAAKAVLVDMAIAQDDYWKAITAAKDLCAYYRSAGDSKMEATTLLQLGNIMLDKGDHVKAGQLAEMALGIFYGLSDQESMQKGKVLLDKAKADKVKEDIELTISKMEDYIHTPTQLIVDPGMSARIQGKYVEVVKGR
jgi:tetratricopeptide (TPR) repeat protein